MELTLEEINLVASRLGVCIENMRKGMEEFIKSIQEMQEKIENIVQTFKQEWGKSNEVTKETKIKTVLRILSPKNIFKRIKQFMKRKV